MPDSLLSQNQKSRIINAIKVGDYRKVISVLESVKTSHAGTAKTKDKRFTIKEIIKNVDAGNNRLLERDFFSIGNKFCKMPEAVAKQIGISLIWRTYRYDKEKVKCILLEIADHPNWEVRESVGGAFASTLYYNDDFYNTLRKWTKHKSANVRRAVVIGSLGLRDRNNPADVKRAFNLLEPLMFDSTAYVKKNLGPFVLGSYFGSSNPKELFKQIDKWVKIKNPRVRWNLAMVFNSSFGHKYPNQALGYLRVLSKDENPIVLRAIKSTLNHLRKRDKNINL